MKTWIIIAALALPGCGTFTAYPWEWPIWIQQQPINVCDECGRSIPGGAICDACRKRPRSRGWTYDGERWIRRNNP